MNRPHEMRLYDHDGDERESAPDARSRANTPTPGHYLAEPIGAGLGWVRVYAGTDSEVGSGPDRVGELTGVELVTAVMTRMRQDRVADHLVPAINSAQQVGARAAKSPCG